MPACHKVTTTGSSICRVYLSTTVLRCGAAGASVFFYPLTREVAWWCVFSSSCLACFGWRRHNTPRGESAAQESSPCFSRVCAIEVNQVGTCCGVSRVLRVCVCVCLLFSFGGLVCAGTTCCCCCGAASRWCTGACRRALTGRWPAQRSAGTHGVKTYVQVW